MHEHIRPASKANKKKVGSNHCPPKRAALTVDPCASLCKSKKSIFKFIMSQLFICGLKTKDIFLFFSLNFFLLDYNFEQFLFCFNNICFLVLLSSMIVGFGSKRQRTLHGEKRNSIFLEGKVETFL